MKTTTTKLSVLAFLGLGLVAYGQSGKVGINISSPQATLDIQPNPLNSQADAKTNEGILAPRLSKSRVAGIETPVEGTLVYVIDDATKVKGTINDYTGSDPKVAKITEKGYYYYNGTEWVKSAAGSLDQEWVYDTTTNRINLKRSGGNLFGNTIFYNKKGARVDYNFTSYDYFSPNENTVTSSLLNLDESLTNSTLREITSSTDLGSATSYTLESKLVNVKDTKEQLSIGGSSNAILIAPTNTKNYNFVRAIVGTSYHNGSGDVKYMVGGYFDGRLDRGISTGYVVGTRTTSSYATDQSSNAQVGAMVFNSVLPTGAGRINRMTDLEMGNSFQNISSLEVTNLRGIDIGNNFGSGSVSITDARGVNYKGLDTTAPNNSVASVVNNYGIYLGNIKGGTQNNYAIYTNAGKVHFGDEVNVVGSITATSIKGSNGTTIFPDYVFQKYYTGTSSLKADYSFKTLSQVEDFVKTNGHLPGYLSASKIKEQGYIDLMATQLTNVEKIEELYLHSIEQEKKIEAQQKQIEELKSLVQELLKK
ncbi:hypothetical protein PG630_00705 [Riemerella anatipestifer]|nr:hypothetical protein [Riemerella anatipestifer]